MITKPKDECRPHAPPCNKAADSVRDGVEIIDISDLRALQKEEFLHDFCRAWDISPQLRGK